MKTLAEQVKAFRTHPQRDWSVKELAERVGTSRQNIENLEAGHVTIPSYIVALADVMDTSIDTLLGRRRNDRTAREPRAAYAAPEQALDMALHRLARALNEADNAMRVPIAETMAAWAREGGPPHYVGVLLLLLTTRPPA